MAKYANRDSVPNPVNRDWGLVVGGKDGVGLFVSPVDETSALWSFSRRSSEIKEQLRRPLPVKPLEELLEEPIQWAANFAPVVKNLVTAKDPSTIMLFNAMDRKLFSHSVSVTGSVIYLGDANHAVSPFAGAGANLALMDALDLAAALKNAPAWKRLFQCMTR